MNEPLNIDWLASYSSYTILIGSFEFNRKPAVAELDLSLEL